MQNRDLIHYLTEEDEEEDVPDNTTLQDMIKCSETLFPIVSFGERITMAMLFIENIHYLLMTFIFQLHTLSFLLLSSRNEY